MERRVGLIIVNYASADLLNRIAVEHSRTRVFVVDNFSSATERKRVGDICIQRDWALIETPNSGFGAGVNIGAQAALSSGCTDLLLLNPDARIDSESIELLLEATSDGMTIASPLVLDPSGRTWFDGLDLYLEDGTIRSQRRRPEHVGARRIEWLSGACLLIPGRAWKLVGKFDEEYFLYWEDVDYSFRAALAGVTLRVVTQAIAHHDEGGTQRSRRVDVPGAKSDLYYYFNVRNRLLFASRHLPSGVAALWSRTAAPNAYRVLLHGGRRQFLRSSAPLWAAYRGLRDGRRILRSNGPVPVSGPTVRTRYPDAAQRKKEGASR